MKTLRTRFRNQMTPMASANGMSFRLSGALTDAISPPKMAMLPIPVQDMMM